MSWQEQRSIHDSVVSPEWRAIVFGEEKWKHPGFLDCGKREQTHQEDRLAICQSHPS